MVGKKAVSSGAARCGQVDDILLDLNVGALRAAQNPKNSAASSLPEIVLSRAEGHCTLYLGREVRAKAALR